MAGRYWPGREGRDRRRGTFTGQCLQPLYSSETTRHPQEPTVITATPTAEESSTEKLPRTSDRVRSLVPPAGRNVIPLGVPLHLAPPSQLIAEPRWLHTS